MTTIDPICGMTVDSATAAGSATRDGQTYYFCSKGCEAEFNAEGEPVESVAGSACCSSSCCGN